MLFCRMARCLMTYILNAVTRMSSDRVAMRKIVNRMTDDASLVVVDKDVKKPRTLLIDLLPSNHCDSHICDLPEKETNIRESDGNVTCVYFEIH